MIKQDSPRAYLLALAAVGVASALRVLLEPWLGAGYPAVTLFVAVGFAAAWGGRGPGVAAVLASVVAAILQAKPVGSLAVESTEARYGVLIFAIAATALAALVVSRQRAVARALARGQLLQTTLASIGDAVITTDADAVVTDLNPVAERLTGWSRARARGRPLVEVFRIVDGDSGEPVSNPALRALRDGSIVSLSDHTRLLARDGREWPIDDSAAPIRGDGGTLLGCVLVFREISERKAAEAALRQHADALAEANRRKEEFLATLAHELRNPLAPVKNALALLRRAEQRPELFEQVRAMMERQIDTMVRLIDELLDVSRIDRNMLTLKRATVAVSPLLTENLQALRAHAECAGISLQLALPDGELHADLDAVRFSQVVTNLLSNACKFTPRGGTVSLSAHAEHDVLVITVRDTGMGIPAEVLERVFDMYWQSGRPMEWAETGLGIGLTLVRQIVQLHGGTVVARSEGPGCGSEFTVRLPVLVPTPPASVAAASSTTPAVRPRRVLIVDDNLDSAESLALLLGVVGHTTAVAHDGPAAVECARSFGPEVVLLDIGLPLMNGYDACRAIRALPGGDAISIVALTGWGQDADRARSAQAGFDDHVVKPAAYETLAALLARV